MIATGLNVLESLSITMITTPSQASGCGIMVNVHSNRAGISGSCPGIGDSSSYIYFFSINHHPKCEGAGFYFETNK